LRNLEAVAILIAAISLASCRLGPSPAAVALDNQRAAAKAADEAWIKPYVGNAYWIPQNVSMRVCEDEKAENNCVNHSGHFRVDGFHEANTHNVILHVTFDNAPSGYASTLHSTVTYLFKTTEPPPLPPPADTTIYPSFLDHLPKKEAEARRKRHGVRLGMYQSEVLDSAWGTPLSKKEFRSSRGIREEWHYPHGNALYFHNRVLEGYEK
jgi:hypothetical protein